jgi:hypothetical protein
MVILPGEDMTFTLNENAGTKYLVTLFSKQALDIQGIMRRFESAGGSVNKRLFDAIEDLITTFSFNENEASFTAMPDNPRTVAALVVAIEHR